MCGRYAIQMSLSTLCRRLGATSALEAVLQSDDACPGGQWPILIRDRIGLADWGFPVIGDGRPMINIRSESVDQKPSFHDSWSRSRRCLVPANAFYEWHGEGKSRRKYRFSFDHDPLFVMAELWTIQEDKPCFAMLTRAADGAAGKLHHRYPCVMGIEAGQGWLTDSLTAAKKNLEKACLQGEVIEDMSDKLLL